MKHGLLLINLGTPDSPEVSAVRRYLREFLADKRVITLPWPLRYLLLYAVILPFRPKRSAHAYKAIWTPTGSPLLNNSLSLQKKLSDHLADSCKVALGMRYGHPSIENALNELSECEHITILPLYPQYSSAATGSSIEKALTLIAKNDVIPSITVIRDFHDQPGFIDAQADTISPYVAVNDYILFSYHGVPENHIIKNECKTLCVNHCNKSSSNYPGCYRAQCLKTTSLLAGKLQLQPGKYGSSFQSRLGRTPWIKPYTDQVLTDLAAQGIKRLAIACPSFVADCLETLEEIGMQAKEQWLQLGGEELTLISCVNDSERWIDGIVQILGSND